MIGATSSGFSCSALLLLALVAAVLGDFSGEYVVSVLTDESKAMIMEHPATTNRSCSPHELFRKFCNTCICHADGNGFICTKNYCEPGHFTEDGIPIPESERKPCKPYDYYKDDCNDCFCKKTGIGGWCTTRNCTYYRQFLYSVDN